MKKFLSLLLSGLFLLMLFPVWGQVYYNMSSADYSQNFNGISSLPTNFSTVGTSSTGTIPIATNTTTASTSSLSVVGSGAAIGIDATTSTRLVFLTTGATDNSSSIATDLNLNFTSRNAGTLSFDASTIFNSTGNRVGSLRIYYSTNGSSWTELTGTNLPYVATNNVAGSASISVSLPSALNNQSTVKLRFYYHNGSGGTTGSRPRIGIDNLSVTSTATSGCSAPTTQASAISFSSITSSSLSLNWTNGSGAGRVIMMNTTNSFTAPSTGANPTANTTYGGSGEQVVFNGTGSGPITINGLTAGNTYHFRVYEYCSPDRTYQAATATSNPNSVFVPKPEPTNFPTAFACGTTTASTIPLSWTAATGAVLPDGYLVKWSTTSYAAIADPVDGTAEANGATTQNVVGTSFTPTGLTASTTYYFKIWSYTNSGSNIDYKLVGEPQTNCATIAGPCFSSNGPSFSASGSTFSGDTDAGGSPTTTIRLASASAAGSISTTATGVTAGNVSLTFRAKGWSSTETSVTVTLDGNVQNVTTLPTSFGSVTLTFTSISANPTLSFSTVAGQRVHIGNVNLFCTPGCTPPSSQTSSVTANNPTTDGFSVGWTAGSGDGTMVVVRPTAQANSAPISGTSYTPNLAWASAAQINTNNRVVFRNSGSTAGPVTGLAAETQYTITAYEYNNTGDCYNLSSPPSANVFTLSTEPTAHAGSFSNTVVAFDQISLSYTSPSGGADGYVILRRADGVVPTTSGVVDGVAPGSWTLPSGTVVANSNATGTSWNNAGLTGSTSYCYLLIPFNWNGINAQTYNYLTTSTVPSTCGTTPLTPSNESNVVDNTNYATGTPEFNSNINYINFIDGTSTTTGKMIPMKFKIQDGGDDLIDADNFNTTLTGIRFTVQNHLGVNQLPQIKTAILTTSGGSVIATASKVGSELVFSGMSGTNVTAVDIDNSGSGDRILHLRVSFDETQVTDNTKLVFAVSSVTAASGSSLFLASNGGGATTDANNTNDRNRIEVTADRLAFAQQPGNVTTGANMSPAPSVAAVDANSNRDLDFSGTFTMSSTGAPSTQPSATASSGLATFSVVNHTSAATGRTLTVNSTGLAFSNTVTSSTFDVIDIPIGSYRTTTDGVWSSSAANNTITWQELTGSGWITMTSPTYPNTNTTSNVYIFNTVTLNGSNTAKNIIVDSTGILSTGTVAPTFKNLLIKDGGVFNKNPGNGLKFDSDGTLEVEDGGTFNYSHTNTTSRSTNLWNGAEKFHPNSNFVVKETDNASENLVIQDTSDVSSFNGAKFGNFIVDMGTAGGSVPLFVSGLNTKLTNGDFILRTGSDNGMIFNSGNYTVTIGGNLLVESTYNQPFTLTNSASTVNFTVNGNVVHNGTAEFRLANSLTTNNPSVTFNIDGNLTLGTSNFNFDIGSSSTGTNKSTLNLKGNLLTGTGNILTTNTNTAKRGDFNFNGTAIQTIDVASTGATTENARLNFNIKSGAYVQLINRNFELGQNSKLTVEDGGILDFGFNGTTPLLVAISGSQTGTVFQSNQGSTLKITSPDGITTTSGTGAGIGNVQVPASNRSFNQVATFHYIGKQNQVTGNAITTGSSGKVIICDLIDNNTQLTFTNSTGITNATGASGTGGKLDIRKGQVIESTTAFITGSTGTLYMSPGTLYQIAKGSATATAAYADLIPRVVGGTFPYILTGGTIELTGNGSADAFQVLRGSQSRPNYIHVKFSGANTYGTDYKALSTQTEIDSSLIVTGTTVVDCITSTDAAASFVGTGGLVMDGGTLRIKKLNDSNPELAGTALNYNLTAGTIEFYGSGATQNQRIRATDGSGTISYNNIEINAAATNLNFGGTLGNVTPAASIVVTGTLNVNKPASFRLDATNSISGAGNFAVNDSSTLFYASPNGIRTSGTGTSDGHIRITGTRTFSSSASYGFISNQNMVSGDALPAQVRNLYCAKSNASNTVTLTNSVQIANTLEMNNGNLITGTNLLELGLSTTERGNLNYTDGHVIGTMKRWFNGTNSGNASGLFPIGVGGADRFATVEYGTAPSAGGSLTARFVSSAMGLSGLPITGIAGTCATFDASTTADEGYWQIDDADGLSGGNYDITLVGEGISTITDLCQVTALKRVGGGNWIQNGTHTDPTGTIGRPIVKRTGANGWSNWGFGGSPVNPLPVVMGSFTADCEADGILLNWVTLSELNSARFVIEQSTDLIHFDYVDMVSAAGNANEPISYTYTVNRPTPSQTQYFRLKQEDFDGASEYFGPVAVSCQEQQAITILVQGSQLNIVGLSANNEALTLKIFDLNGKELRKEIIPSFGNLVNSVLNLSTINSGIYFIHLTSSTFSHTQKIVVTH